MYTNNRGALIGAEKLLEMRVFIGLFVLLSYTFNRLSTCQALFNRSISEWPEVDRVERSPNGSSGYQSHATSTRYPNLDLQPVGLAGPGLP